MGKKDEWVNLKPANAILPAPTRVRLTGLVQARYVFKCTPSW